MLPGAHDEAAGLLDAFLARHLGLARKSSRREATVAV
jgi:hypothetical protein